MKKFLALVSFVILIGCQSTKDTFQVTLAEQQTQSFKKLCPALQNVEIEWDNASNKAQSYLVIAQAETKNESKIFWVAYNIPRRQEHLSNKRQFDKTWQIGRNDFGSVDYENPCEAMKGVHQVKFTVYALSEKVPPFYIAPTRQDLMTAIDKKIVDTATLTLK